MKFVLESLAGLAGGIAGWLLVGFLAAQFFTSVGGSREGANAMGGFFFVGPIGGIAGFVIAFQLARRWLERGSSASPGSFAATMVALGVVVALVAALLVAIAALRAPESREDLYGGEEGRIEFEIIVPAAALAGRAPAEILSVRYVAIEGHDERNEPLTWSEARGRDGVTLNGHVVVRERTTEQWFAIAIDGDEFKLYPDIPDNMHRDGTWIPRLYLTRDGKGSAGDFVRATCRYVAPAK